MKLHTISLKNYRLIKEASIQLEIGTDATILVGPNNSGKTSVSEAISSFLSGTIKSFAISDFSVRTHSAFKAFESAALAGEAARTGSSSLPSLPSIRIDLHLRYDNVAEDLIVADELLMDLDETSSEIQFRIELQPVFADELAAAFKSIHDKDPKWSLLDFLATRLHQHYELWHYKVARDGASQRIASDDANRLVRRLIRVDFLPAQRHMEDQESSQQATRLSRLLSVHYERRYKVAQPESYEALEIAVRDQAADLTQKYGEAFAELKGALQTFGYPGTPDLTIRAELSASAIFKNNTRVFYTAEIDADEGEPQYYELPERYNGLGFKN